MQSFGQVASSGNSANWDPPKNIPLDDVTKWTLLDQEETQSVFTAPKLIEPTAFEHLKTASILGGPNARPKVKILILIFEKSELYCGLK